MSDNRAVEGECADTPLRIVVLISGSGSNLQALIDATNNGPVDATIEAVISNKKDAYGLERAAKAGIPGLVLEHQNFSSREAFDAELANLIDRYEPDLVVLAGFMRILSQNFVQRYLGKLVNIHPSLLPRYPGLHTHQRALESGDKDHGASIHFVIPELDAGPVLLQGVIRIQEGESADQLASRILRQVEHKIYPKAISWIAQGRVQFQSGKVYLDKEPLPVEGRQINYNNS